VEAQQIAADLWLEYSFGWAPLVSDIHSAVGAYDRLRKQDTAGKVVEASWTKNLNAGNQVFAGDGFSVLGGKWLTYKTDVQVTRCHIIGMVKPVYSGFATPEMRLFGWSLDRFVPTVWELIPYSWLADYFFNINNILEAVCFLEANLRWTSMTTVNERTWYIVSRFDEASTRASALSDRYVFSSVKGTDGQAALAWKTVSRGAPGSFVPSLSWRFPRFLAQAVNIGSLLIQHNHVKMPR